MTALLFSSIDSRIDVASADGVTATLSLSNRGLCYGDGLFETIRYSSDEMPLLVFHRERFALGVKALKLGDVNHALEVFDQAIEFCQEKLRGLGHCEALIKVIFTRREGGRGYVPAAHGLDVFIQIFEAPCFASESYEGGVDVILCEHRLSHQPLFAGIKHLNRLDQVLAASELQGAAEGLVCDQDGLVVEGTKSNLIVFSAEGIVTPRIRSAGVAGALRAYLLSGGVADINIKEVDVSVSDLQSAKGLALVNSVFGCWPIKSFNGETYPIDPQCRQIQLGLASELNFYNSEFGEV
jgi:4-amino-4-deoxychorismate lyase